MLALRVKIFPGVSQLGFGDTVGVGVVSSEAGECNGWGMPGSGVEQRQFKSWSCQLAQ